MIPSLNLERRITFFQSWKFEDESWRDLLEGLDAMDWKWTLAWSFETQDLVVIH